MTSAEAWVRQHARSAPKPLVDAMIGALEMGAAQPIPDVLAAAAVELYEGVVQGSGGREAALPLLAADALFTQAFHAQAELDPAGIETFSERWGGRGRLREIAGGVDG